MIEEMKDVLLQFFEAEGKTLNRENIIVLRYEEMKQYAIGFFETTLPDFEYYEIIYNDYKNGFTIDVYQKVRSAKATRNHEE